MPRNVKTVLPITLLVFLLLALFADGSAYGDYSQVIAFGDSTSDNGTTALNGIADDDMEYAVTPIRIPLIRKVMSGSNTSRTYTTRRLWILPTEVPEQD